MSAYAGIVDPELIEDFKHRVTHTPKIDDGDNYTDDWGRRTEGVAMTDIPSLWVGKIQLIADAQKGNIVSSVTVYLPHDVPVKVGDTLTNQETGEAGSIIQVRPPIYSDDNSIPYTAWLGRASGAA